MAALRFGCGSAGFRTLSIICGLLLLASLAHGWAGTLAQFRTVFGDIEVELYDQDKPVTVRNFIRYVQGGSYRDMFLHRCVPGFIVQGGGYFATNRFSTNPLPAFAVVASFGAITNEFNVGRHFSNTYGTLAMAKLGGDPNSASSEWFFNLADNTANLDNQNGGFTVFGRMVSGTNILNRFNTILPDLKLANAGGALSDLPVLNPGTNVLTLANVFSYLVYVDISLLNVQVKSLANKAREISWNSVSNTLNRVEFTTNLPPIWNLLVSTNGTGGTLRVTDTNSANLQRFYRVRVDF